MLRTLQGTLSNNQTKTHLLSTLFQPNFPSHEQEMRQCIQWRVYSGPIRSFLSCILNLFCFLHFFYLSTPFAAKMWFLTLCFNGKMPKICLTFNKIEMRPKNDKFIHAQEAKFGECLFVLEFWFGQLMCHLFGLKDGPFWQRWGDRDSATLLLGDLGVTSELGSPDYIVKKRI